MGITAMAFSPSVSLGDVIMGGLAAVSLIYNFAVYSLTIKQLQNDVRGMKRGEGYIMGPNTNWPPTVQRCFGYGRERYDRSATGQ
jgi:hypothetical protein